MNELIDKAGGLSAAVLLIAVCFNAILSALSIILGKIKDLTATDADNKAYEFIGGLISGLQKIVDFLGANISHK